MPLALFDSCQFLYVSLPASFKNSWSTYSLMHIPSATTTLPVRSADSYPLLISSVKARALAPTAAAPEEAYRSVLFGPCLRPPPPPCQLLLPVDIFRQDFCGCASVWQLNWPRQVRQVHDRALMRVAIDVLIGKGGLLLPLRRVGEYSID